MSDGNDWQSPDQPPQNDWNPPQQPSQPDPAFSQAPKEKFTEGWGAADFNFGAYIDHLKLVFGRGAKGPVLKAHVALTLPNLAFGLLAGILVIAAYYMSGGAGRAAASLVLTIAGFLSMVLIPLGLVLGVIQLSLYKPIARQIFEGPVDIGGMVDSVKSAASVALHVGLTMLVLSFGISIAGLCCVVPGLIVGFLFSQAPYLVAVHDVEILDAFTQSLERAKRHWSILLMGIGTSLVIFVPLLVVYVVGSLVLGHPTFLPFSLVILPPVRWVFFAALGVIGFVISVTTFTLIDEREGKKTIAR